MSTSHDDDDRKSYLEVNPGWRNWAVTLDHKRIGLMYLFGILGALMVGGVFALLIRTELFFPGKTIVSQDMYKGYGNPMTHVTGQHKDYQEIMKRS